MLNLEKSAAAFAEAKKLMPGGVNSPVRSYRSVTAIRLLLLEQRAVISMILTAMIILIM